MGKVRTIWRGGRRRRSRSLAYSPKSKVRFCEHEGRKRKTLHLNGRTNSDLQSGFVHLIRALPLEESPQYQEALDGPGDAVSSELAHPRGELGLIAFEQFGEMSAEQPLQ